MASAKNARITHLAKTPAFGLLANGSSGPWEIAIDGTTSGPARWFAQIEGPAVVFYFEIASLDIVDKMLGFFEPRVATEKAVSDSFQLSGSLVIGKDKKNPIALIKDDEYDDRFFLAVGPVDSPIVRFTIAGEDAERIADALRQIQEDLDDED